MLKHLNHVNQTRQIMMPESALSAREKPDDNNENRHLMSLLYLTASLGQFYWLLKYQLLI